MEKNNFHFLFVGLLSFLAVEPFLGGSERSAPLIQLAFMSILVLGVVSLVATRLTFRVGLVLAGISLASAIVYLITGSVAARVIDLVAICSFLVLSIGVSSKQVVLSSGPVTLNRVVGALCLYLLLGILWAILYAMVEIAEPLAFDFGDHDSGDPMENFIYYSFVTLTTLGFGDITPVHPVARTLAYLEAVVGQLYTAVLIASLVGGYIATRRAVAEAPPDPPSEG